MPRTLVTGGAGFLGSHLCEYLLNAGHEVIAMDNLLTGTTENIEHLRSDRFKFIKHDVTEYIYLAGGLDYILHFASPASPMDYLQLPIQTMKVGALGTHKALGLAKDTGATFLLASTSEVYGDPLEHPQKEDYWGHVNPVGPRGVYDEAKRFAEALTMAYHRTHGVDTKIVRIFNTYGPRMRPNDGRAIPAFIPQALRNEPLTVFGDGSQTRSFCYVDDLIEGIYRLLLSDYHEPVNIGNPHEMTIRELAETIVRVTGSSSTIIERPLPVDDPKVRQPDISLARRILGWEPKTSLTEGLEKTVAWFRQLPGMKPVPAGQNGKSEHAQAKRRQERTPLVLETETSGE
ncbi:MAG: SDR family oxidoreductase [candidate division KSB1 bacterium]|nr:SDR family oxidoreductase [candidate division KSB1 bacterium]MDZ7275687.1 SDR family oxidoreductase [candidate division KSB1 bacterium]MDZ7284622.1 SDR family oxidoreductase [candidate division KSB1 bacterium]MDZ7297959.1 SDR family oxidoreductase [candidate division KSB1 bacterium]MDZ7348824.1 SDR family oxidoreductase [candidate division KSB1 bacterium]